MVRHLHFQCQAHQLAEFRPILWSEDCSNIRNSEIKYKNQQEIMVLSHFLNNSVADTIGTYFNSKKTGRKHIRILNCGFKSSYLARNAIPSIQSFVEYAFTYLPATTCREYRWLTSDYTESLMVIDLL